MLNALFSEFKHNNKNASFLDDIKKKHSEIKLAKLDNVMTYLIDNSLDPQNDYQAMKFYSDSEDVCNEKIPNFHVT